MVEGSNKSGFAISRRELLRDAAAAGAAATVLGPVVSRATARAAAGKRVAVLGGGMAGMTVAHELAERGFAVTVYERRAFGGKARSIDTPGAVAGGRLPLPGEHGFRFFPGFYHHIPDTMRRIPYTGNANGVYDNFVGVPLAVASLVGNDDLTVPFALKHRSSWQALTPELLAKDLASVSNILQDMPFTDLLYFANRLFVFLTSCDERRTKAWENTTWTTFAKPGGKSPAYRKLLVNGLTRVLVAARPDKASTRTIATMGEAFIYSLFGFGNDGMPDRVLNAPTNEAWINPWVTELQRLGVDLKLGWEVQSLNVTAGKISGVGVQDPKGVRGTIDADYYVCALPPERAVKLWNPDVRRLDPQFGRMDSLVVDWMSGIQFFLKRDAPLGKAHMAYMDSPWAITSINQAQFWNRDIPATYGDGSVRDILSVDISDWDTPGVLFGKTARQCSPQEVAQESWEQIKRHVNDRAKVRLRDEDLHSWFLDNGLKWDGAAGTYTNEDPLLINTAGSLANRPEVRTNVPNLYLAGDYVKTNVDLATMEGANEAGRKAVNALLHDSGSSAAPAQTYKLHRPREFDQAKKLDQARWKLGLRNVFDFG